MGHSCDQKFCKLVSFIFTAASYLLFVRRGLTKLLIKILKQEITSSNDLQGFKLQNKIHFWIFLIKPRIASQVTRMEPKDKGKEDSIDSTINVLRFKVLSAGVSLIFYVCPRYCRL